MQTPLLAKDNGVQRELYEAGILCQVSITAEARFKSAPMAVYAGVAKCRLAYVQVRLFAQRAPDEFAGLFDEHF
eukprot:8024602-Alexandrium_andersonii.AAC.1